MSITKMFEDEMESKIDTYTKWLRTIETTHRRTVRELKQYIPAKLFAYRNAPNTNIWAYLNTENSNLTIVIPWNPVLYDEIALLLMCFGWKMVQERKVTHFTSPEYWTRYEHPEVSNFHISFKMESERNDSTCKLIQTGTKIVEKPIYEVRCGDEF